MRSWTTVAVLLLCLALAGVGCSGSQEETSQQLTEVMRGNIVVSNEAIIERVLSNFEPEMREYLASIPIVLGDVRTAVAMTTHYERPGNEYIIVNFDWDKKCRESIYWDTYREYGKDKDSPAFSTDFKCNLLTHEYLHHAELKAGIDIEAFFQEVSNWYYDPEWGNPSPDSNYQKYTVFWNVYGGNGSDKALMGGHNYQGQGEFAYIGERIANRGKERLWELPSTIIQYYKGILRSGLFRMPSNI